MSPKKHFFQLGLAVMLFSNLIHQPCADEATGAGPERKIFLRVTLGKGYEKPFHVHIFAMPGAGHYAISKDGLEKTYDPTRPESLLKDGDRTPWCDITGMVSEHGARLMISPDTTYSVKAPTFDAVLEFATAAADNAVVKAIQVHYSPSTINILVPASLDSPENIAKLRTDREMAEATGAIADAMKWPTLGEVPARFPFYVTMNLLPDKFDRDVCNRELRTVRHFGFNGVGIKSDGGLDWHRYFESFGLPKKFINGNIWYPKSSFSSPDTGKMKEWGGIHYQENKRRGLRPDELTYINLMDEPVGETLDLLSRDEASIAAFKAWVKSLGKSPEDLLVASWDEVRPATEAQRESHPALYYFTQRFRSHALGEFMVHQKNVLSDIWQTQFLAAANFSDGAVYSANFYAQGVDYFEILHGTQQNAVWGEDWANISSTFQCGAFNAQLMRDAARKHGQTLGSFLIICDGRKSLDLKLKAMGLVSRGAKILDGFYYGAAWGGHEKGMLIQSPREWYGLAEVIREIGAVEEWLLEARPRKAQTALLYSSASDIWTLNKNHAYGFDRMHNWLALTHAQVPVDIVHESEAADGFLKDYKVCYLSGPNLSSAGAQKLKQWVLEGGTLVMTAGAASQDEYNRDLTTIAELLPVGRDAVQQFEARNAEGRGLANLAVQDTVKTATGSFEVLSVKQGFKNGKLEAGQILGTYADGSAAIIKGKAGKGTVICYGFLPSLHYIKQALDRRNRSTSDLLEKSYNPWEYPSDARDFITAPVLEAGVELPIQCSSPLVDATCMECSRGILIPLANHTLQPIASLKLGVRVSGAVKDVVSVHHGKLEHKVEAPNQISFSLPLDSTDFVKIAMK